ncbi:fasciclin domain-containing protein [Pontibacter sp. Tf4]|uniref:fasciclin domain-containing protein n=1 Tax=Pontibacter sp. Tf4 TaxID=2761620 RepID=UPI001629E79C|nr:fasciclin domain-containing protein [Pontibacter sp. Tf4]MBB6610886.1 fasciclin domain-containing protein [Pontibacter sp. Tf4]
MENNLLKKIAAIVAASVFIVGCAGSDTTTISQTQTMEGDAPAEPVAEPEALNYDALFEDLGNTARFDILALANSNQHLTTFVTLTEKAGITDVLKSEGPFTVFIPTNEAFDHLSKKEFDALLEPENRVQLLKVLQAHILPNKVYTSQLKDNQRIKTADHKVINVQVSPDKIVTIGGAKVVKSNVEVSNGVVHIVDDVITTSDAGPAPSDK